MQSMLAFNYGLPMKVVEKARSFGAHNDCLVAGARDTEKMCPGCAEAVLDALNVFYYEVPKDQVMDQIEADIRQERESL